MELNIEAVRQVAMNNVTSKAIFEELMTRERSRAQINLRKFRYDMLSKGKHVDDESFIEVFKKLHTLGIGTVVNGRNGKPTRFVWNYKLKKVAEAGTSKEHHIVDIKKQAPVRTTDKMVSITFDIPLDTRAEDLAALISLARGLETKD